MQEKNGIKLFLLFCFCLSVKECLSRKIRRRHLIKENDILARYPGQDDYISPTSHITAAAGGSATLPCDLSSTVQNDPAVLVLWYKKGVIKPIYSYDIRSGSAQHWKNSFHLGNRAKFDPNRGALIIQRISASDATSYRCRVDFKTNPTLSYAVNLTVIVPPQRLWIVASSELDVDSKVGPYQEGDNLRLRCESLGGDPAPKVTWWDGFNLLDSQDEISSTQQVANILVINRLRREDLNRRLTCKSSNTNLTAPLETFVIIDMIFPPKTVQILSAKEALSAGRRYEVTCKAIGSKPSATIKWHIKSETLASFTSQISDRGNITISTLQFTPRVEDNGKELQCISHTILLPDLPVIDSWKLNVYFPPKVSVHPGRSLNLNNIEENADVYFECVIQANPQVYKIIWYHQGKELHHDVSRGIIISNQSLVLQRIQRTSSGLYSCKASNIEGDGVSSTLELTVKFSPICQKQQALFHGAAPNEKVDIPCYIEAHPEPEFFSWTFNNSGESATIPDSHVRINGFQSTVSYTPKTELDYGTLLCIATNSVGKQKQPCVFHVFPAGRPDPVHNCTQFNFSESSVNIRCHPGFDGGLPQSFLFELFDPDKRKLLANVTNNEPVFSVGDLPSATFFSVIVYPANSKGRGENYSFKTYTLKDNAEKRTAAIKPAPSSNDKIFGSILTPVIAIALGIVIGILIVIAIIVSFLKIRRRRCRRRENLQEKSSHEVSVHESQKAPSTQVLIQSSSMSSDNEEVNPDLIPRRGDKSFYKGGIGGAVVISTNVYSSQRKTSSTATSSKTPTGDSAGEITIEHRDQMRQCFDQMYLPSSDKRAKQSIDRFDIKEAYHNAESYSEFETQSEWQLRHNISSVESDANAASFRSGTMPWNHNLYQNKLRIGSELETIEPLLKSQRESSV